MLGPTGIGGLYIKSNILDSIEPYQTGGQMIDRVNPNASTWNDIPFRFEAGTPNIAGAIGIASAVDYIKELTINKIQLHNHSITEYCIGELSSIDGIKIYGHNKKSGPVISFNIEGVHSYDLSSLLAKLGIYIRSGHHCAQPIMRKLNISASNRISFYIYNDLNDIDRLIEGVKKSQSMLVD